jgi:hypothetical protein
MKNLSSRKWNMSFVFLLALICLVMLFLTSCGQGPETPSDTGSIAFSVKLKGISYEGLEIHAMELDCDATGVETVVAEIYDEASLYLTSGGPWLCSAHAGTIQNVLTGTNRTIVVLGKDINGNVIYWGEKSGVTVTAGQTTNAGTIEVEPFDPPFDPPTLISPTDGETVIGGSYSFEWDPIKGASEYLIQVSTDSNFVSTVINETVTTEPYTPTTPLTTGTYCWRVRAEDSYGNQSAWSEVWGFTVSAESGVAPSAPTNVTATAGNEKVTLGWNSVPGAISYNIYWATYSGVSKADYEGKIEDVTSTSYTHTGLTTGTTYYYIVTAENSYGESVESSELSTTPEQDKWVETGAMNEARMLHSATLLPDGKVLIAGGASDWEVGANAYDTAELYDPISGTFSFTGNMNVKRAWHFPMTGPGVALLNNGLVLITGGSDINTTHNSTELYDSLTETFSYTSDMPYESMDHSAILLQDGRVLVAPLESKAAIYDPSIGTFSSITNALVYPRSFHTVTLLPNGKVLVAGGRHNSTVLSSAELFDPATETFSETGEMNYERYLHSATLLPDGRVLITGGTRWSDILGEEEALNSAEIYDPETESFSIIDEMDYARSHHPAILLLNGKVLIGGTGGRNCQLFDPSTGQFAVTDEMSLGRSFYLATLLADGSVLVTGSDLRASERYIPSPPSDSTFPSNPSITINNGGSSTSFTNVTLTLSATDDTGVFGYFVSESSTTPLATLSSWIPIASTTNYSADVPFLLTTGDGEKTVYVWFKDVAGNVSGVVSDSITLISGTALPDTGQTQSYTDTFGEDSDYSINPASYTDNGDGTVTDNVTGLMWQQEDDDTTRTWDEACSYCDELALAGYSDWRLASKKELMSIVDYGTYSQPFNRHNIFSRHS